MTGVAGFIGSHVAERLLQRGDEVVGIDNFDALYDPAEKRRNIAGFGRGFRLVTGDILDASTFDEAAEGGPFDAMIHLAALAGVRPSVKDPARYQRVNVEGTARVATACLKSGSGRLVFASSSSVYGANTKVPFAEDDRVDSPVSPYASSKRAAELLLASYVHTEGLSVTALRYFTVYGPRQRPEMAIHTFCRAIDRGETLTLYGDGQSERDYTYIDDIVAGTVAALDRPQKGLSIYNLGGERTTKLIDLVHKLGKVLEKEPKIRWEEACLGDVEITFAAVDKARRDLGYEPEVGLDEGLARFVAWYRGRR